MKKGYESEVKRGNFVRALYLAKKLGFPEQEIVDIAHKALWQVAVIGRNLYATKKLAEELGYSKEEVKEILKKMVEKEPVDKKILGECYEYNTGKYLSFDKWLELLLKEWKKIN